MSGDSSSLVVQGIISRSEDTPMRKYYPIFVGVDIGADFHVAAVIPSEDFAEGKAWKKRKTLKFNADSDGINSFLNVLSEIKNGLGFKTEDIFILMEPTGGNYSFLIMTVLSQAGYMVHLVENKSVKKFREDHLGYSEKSDELDARIMAYMGWHWMLHPSMKGVRIAQPHSASQILFRSVTRERWLMTTQLTRRKNQIQQLFSVTHPDLKRAFKKPGNTSVLRFAQQYPSAKSLIGVPQDELRLAIIQSGAKNIATKAAQKLSEVSDKIAIEVPHIIQRQMWLIEDALRIQDSLNSLESQMKDLLHGDPGKGIPPHPYTSILKSFPAMSDINACTLIGAFGDIERFEHPMQFKKFLGVSAETKKSGKSVHQTHQTYSGVRDSRRVLFLMAMVLQTPNIGPNVFKAHYQRLVNGRKNRPPMPKMKALGHVCGKLAVVLYACLRNGTPYDPRKHAASCGVVWDEKFAQKYDTPEIDGFEDKADELAMSTEILCEED